MVHPHLKWRRRSFRCRPRCEAAGCSHKVSTFRAATARPVQPAMAVSGSPPRPETPSMSLFTSRRPLPSGMSRAIKALDKKSATPSHCQVAASKLQSRAGAKADLTNVASQLTCKTLRCACSNVELNCQWSLCVCRSSGSRLNRSNGPWTRCRRPLHGAVN